MKESFLHYIWQFQYFSKTDLRTTDGEKVTVFAPGHGNTHAGPDFHNARISIGDMEWVGNVEIHIDASGWQEHKHDTDQAYDNVILHVVWKNDKRVKRSDGSLLPTLELKNRVDERLLLRYKRLINSPEEIPCSQSLSNTSALIKFSMLDKAFTTRLETKASGVTDLLKKNNNDWEETGYQLLARNFGFKVNADPFQQLAQNLRYKIFMKHADKLVQLEALLFGQAGFLEDDKKQEAYYQTLRREYLLLTQKYSLAENRLNKAQWRFLRLRPANFPTIRLAQFAMLIYQQRTIFSKMIAADSYRTLREIFTVQQSAYWLRHYQFGKETREEAAMLGEESINNIIINTVVPLLAAYGKAKDEQIYVDKAVTILQQLHAESNKITRQWEARGLSCKSAFDSQALIELYNNFCSKRRCLDCTIGVSLLKPI